MLLAVACNGNGGVRLLGIGFLLGCCTLSYKLAYLDLVIIWFMVGGSLILGEGMSLLARLMFSSPTLSEFIKDLTPLFHGPGVYVVWSESDE